MIRVYLSGGMYSHWQDTLPIIPDVVFLDPRHMSPQNAMVGFVKEDIELVRQSDLIFCYMEQSNPTGYGSAFECAIAYERSIPIITVWEKPYIDPFFAGCSKYLYSDLKTGAARLVKEVEKLKNQRLGE